VILTSSGARRTDLQRALACACPFQRIDAHEPARVDLGRIHVSAKYYLLVLRMAADDSRTRLFIIIYISSTNTPIAYLPANMHAREMEMSCSHVSCQGDVSPVPVITANDCIY
jgi:hypothetical protein